MLTVKEFKDLGVEFVEGDKRSSSTYRHGGVVMTDELARNTNLRDGVDIEVITSFAWRTNTGVKPRLVGEIEVTWQNDEVEVINASDYPWSLSESIHIVKWRPLLEQSKKSAYDVDAHVSGDKSKGGVIPNNILGQMHEVDKRETIAPNKPVFTQAMADAGELPPVGSEFLHNGEVVLCISTTSHDGGAVTFRRLTQGNGPDIACCWNNKSWVKPIDPRTPKQKAVDDMMLIIHYSDENEVICSDLYDAKYRKC